MTDVQGGLEGEPALDLTTPIGAQLQTMYVRRAVKAYALHESDVELLGQLTFHASSFFAAASFFIALALGIFASASFVADDAMPATGLVLRNFGVPLLALVAAACALMGWQAHHKRTTKWSEIKSTSSPA